MTTWNTFVDAHPKAYIIAAVVSSRLPKGVAFDAAGKKLPTPYRLFCEWLAGAALEGLYTTTSVPNGFVVGLAEAADRDRLVLRFGPLKHGGFKLGGQAVKILSGYSDGAYAGLAADLGYRLDFLVSRPPI